MSGAVCRQSDLSQDTLEDESLRTPDLLRLNRQERLAVRSRLAPLMAGHCPGKRRGPDSSLMTQFDPRFAGFEIVQRAKAIRQARIPGEG